MSDPVLSRPRRALGRRGWTITCVGLGVLLLVALALAVWLALPPRLEPVPVPTVSAA